MGQSVTEEPERHSNVTVKGVLQLYLEEARSAGVTA